MNLNQLTALSPIDGRYRKKTESLAPFFSEFGLIKYRVQVEVEYFITLTKLPIPGLKTIDPVSFIDLRKLYQEFSLNDAESIKAIEQVTNHDVKAVEYFIKEKMDGMGLSAYKEYVHFGLTSQDINNTATPLSMKEAMEKVILPAIDQLQLKLTVLSESWKAVPMLARTHGQPASPTRLGKEIQVFAERLHIQAASLKQIPFAAKFGGATGNFNAHYVAFPTIDWVQFGNTFVNNILGLHRSQTTTQIEHYDHIAAFFDNIKRLSSILIDLNRDVWTYISMDYFKQTIRKGEVGSSAMPHKVNPIDFENSEGNLGICIAFSEHLAAKLPVSRLQRDLTDSTVLRNIGVPLSHFLIAIESTLKGLNKLLLNQDKINRDLEENRIVIAEAIQTVLRREAYPEPYEALKALTRTNEKITEKTFLDFIEQLAVSETIKEELRKITPYNYTGI